MTRRKRTDAQDELPESMRPGHTPYWPSKRDTAILPVERTLAYMAQDGSVVAETGETWEKPGSWEVFKQLLFAENMQLFVGDLHIYLDEWWDCLTAEIEEDEPDSVRKKQLLESGRDSWVEMNYSPTSGGIVSLSVSMYCLDRTMKRRCWQKRHIIQATSWAGSEPGAQLIRDLRTLFTLLGTGITSTPGSAGAKTMYALWREHPDGTMPRHHRPTSECLSDILEHAVGSLKDTWRPDEVFTQAYELDRTNGFAAECRRLPSGTVRGPLVGRQARYLLAKSAPGGVAIPCYTWWGRCAVRIEAPGLPPGDVAPFVVRTGTTPDAAVLANGMGSGELKAPTEPGVYEVWCFRETAEEIERRRLEEGAPMEVLSVDRAWYWTTYTDQMAEWADRMDSRRREAAAASERIATLVKSCMVTGIGRWGMGPFSYRVITERRDGDTELLDNGVYGVPLYLRRTPADNGNPKHWHAYILEMENLSILKVAHEGYRKGLEPIGANVDSITFARDPREVGMGVEREAAAMGDYKINDYHTFSMPLPGVLIAEEKIRTPGITKQRQRLLLHGLDPSQGDTKASGMQGAREAFSRQMHAAAGRASPEECERLRQWFRKHDTMNQEQRFQAWEASGGWHRIAMMEQRLRKGERQRE